MAKAFEASKGDLAERMLAALDAEPERARKQGDEGIPDRGDGRDLGAFQARLPPALAHRAGL